MDNGGLVFALQARVPTGLFQRGPPGGQQLRPQVPGHQGLLSLRTHPEDHQGLDPADHQRPVGVPGPQAAARDRADAEVPARGRDRHPDLPGGREERAPDEPHQEGRRGHEAEGGAADRPLGPGRCLIGSAGLLEILDPGPVS